MRLADTLNILKRAVDGCDRTRGVARVTYARKSRITMLYRM